MSARESGKVLMAKLARINNRKAAIAGELAQLAAEEAQIFTELADGETVDMRNGRRRPEQTPAPTGPVSELDAARAKAVLNRNELRRRVGR